jgi:hypothetical protein
LPEIVTRLCPDLVLADTTVGTLADGLKATLRGGLKLPDEESCRAYAAGNFSWRLIASRTARIYRDALGSAQ